MDNKLKKDMNIEEVDISESAKEKLSKKKVKIAKFVVYGALFIYSLIISKFFITDADMNVVLGDFGSILPILFKTIAIMGFKWLPIFGVCGVITTIFEEKLGDFPNSFLVIVLFITFVSSVLFFII